MKLVVFSHKLFRRTPNGLQTDGALTIQMDALADQFDKLLLCVPVVDDPAFQGVSTTATNISFLPLPHFAGKAEFVQALLVLRKRILAATKQADMGLVILPSYLGVYASWLCQKQDFPIFQWVVGNWRKNVYTHRPDGFSRGLAHIWTPTLDWIMTRLTKNVLTFFNGLILYHPPQPHHYTRLSSSIRMEDIADLPIAKLTTLQKPYQLLFVGRLSPEKGIIYLLQSLAQLTSFGEEVILHIVGDGELKNVLKQETTTLAIADHVKFHGFIPQGERLRRLYQQSDVFILPTLQDQQPKVLTEAMSQGVPVIATRTGGIPTIIQDLETGLLITPAQPEAITTSVQNILRDNDLRSRLIRQGLERARERTVEAETKKMMRIVSTHFNLSEHLL